MFGKLLARLEKHLRSQEPGQNIAGTASSDSDPLDVLLLEERILYSAVPLGDVCETPSDGAACDAGDIDFDGLQESFAAIAANATRGTEDASIDPNLPDDVDDADDLLAPLGMQSPGGEVRYELVFVDCGVDDLDTLLEEIASLDEVSRVIETIFIDSTQNGIEQITNELVGRTNVDAIHVVSQGAQGQVRLGNAVLSHDSLRGYAGEIALWADALSHDADILFYGCNLADGEGKTFIDALAALTGADVAAGVDATGNEDLGGDWILDYGAGVSPMAIEALTSFDVVLIDSQLNDSSILLDAASEDAIVFVYDSTQDSANDVLQEVLDWANAEASTIDSLSILSHGVEGAFQLGTDWVTSSTLDTTSEHWRQLSTYLTTDAEIYILGCDVTGGSGEGMVLLEGIADLTSADVFASDDVTGVGGDWVLESSTAGTERGPDGFPMLPFDLQALEAADVSLAWYDLNWGYRRQITIDETMVAGTTNLSNFAVLVTITDPGLRSTGNGGNVGQTDGGDFLFTSANGTTKLDHQIESYNATTGQLVAWVEVPSLGATTDTDLYLYYGNAGASNQWNNTGTWNSSYGGVWHLASDYQDSTSNSNHGTNNGTTNVSAGQIGAADDFDGTGDYISTTSTQARTANSFTISTWFNADSTTYTRHLIWQGESTADGWGGGSEMHISVGSAEGGTPTDHRLSFFLGDNVNTDPLLVSTNFSDTSGWHQVTVVVSNMSTTPTAAMYLDGVLVDTDTGTTANTPRGTWDTPLRFGGPGAATRYFDGQLDEVRLATTTRNANWVSTEYNNQSNPAGYLTFGVETPAVTPTIVVDTASDVSDGDTSSVSALLANKGADGFISLREAIIAANNQAGADTIEFNIAGNVVHTINLGSVLPDIVGTVTIDATTESDFAGSPRIVISGGGTIGLGLKLYTGSDGSTVRGLAMQGFTSSAISISTDGNTIVGNYIGTTADGSAAAVNRNYDGVTIWSGDNNIIGGTTAADRNIISGQTNNGVVITASANNTQVIGNYIGTDATGLNLIGNSIHGIFAGDVSGLILGGDSVAKRNLIAGQGYGIQGSNLDNSYIQGNYFGLAVNGSTVLGNGWDAIYLTNGSTGNVIGTNGDNTNDLGERNVIVAAGSDGIRIDGEASDGNTIAGNYLGVVADGTTMAANGSHGVHITNGADNTIIGGTGTYQHNVIAGSVRGIEVWGASSGTQILGNYIGTDESGTLDLGATWQAIYLGNAASNTTIGSTLADGGNVLANAAVGVRLESSAGTGNSIRGNSIYGNDEIGIDLVGGTEDANGRTSNDAGDTDTGPNQLQNWAAINSFATDGSGNLEFDIDTTNLASGTYSIDFYASTDLDGGEVEGARYLGSASSIAGGDNSIVGTFSGGTAASGEYITLVTTDSSGNSSEFSAYATAIVLAHNVLPTLVDDLFEVAPGATTTGNVLANDTDADGGTLAVIDYSNPTQGTLINNNDGTFDIVGGEGYFGATEFSYRVDDGQTGLTHFYGMNGDATDSVGANDAVSINGDAAFGEGTFGQGIWFDEAGDYVVIPDFAYNNEFTVSFDFKVDENSGSLFQYLYSHGTASTANSLNIYIGEASHSTYNNQLFTNLQDSDDAAYAQELNFDISSLIGDGQWHNYTLTVGSAGAVVYIDGVQRARTQVEVAMLSIPARISISVVAPILMPIAFLRAASIQLDSQSSPRFNRSRRRSRLG
ncbi:MAG: DUF2341 domain-containing protein [Pirellulaceae bacterium]